ncbi:MAG: hypothetical protein Q4E53_10755 [Eubacteriales bacterium]|nr:hypothetical protein [Eubacteriales bacterium]
MKKYLFLVLSLVMLMAVPMTVSANVDAVEDDSVTVDPVKKTSTKKKNSPKTADNGMAEVAVALFAISGGILAFTKKELDRA